MLLLKPRAVQKSQNLEYENIGWGWGWLVRIAWKLKLKKLNEVIFKFSNKYIIKMSYYKTNIKCQEIFDILRMLRGNDSEHIKRGNCTVPIIINDTHMVKFTHTSVEAWPQLSLDMLLSWCVIFFSNLRQFNFLPTSQRNVRLND